MAHLTRFAFAVVCLTLLSACEPIGPIPGRSLAGDVGSLPHAWEAFNNAEVVQLEVNGPYSVNVWGVGLHDFYYVAAAEGLESRWAQRIAVDPNVRLRIGDTIFELAAQVVDDDKERQRVGDAFSRKYDIEASEDFPEVVIYRLGARP